jgi:hypothetical protein
LQDACNGNTEALEFVDAWRHYIKAIDDMIDEQKHDPETLVKTLALACLCYSTMFYAKNSQLLKMLVLAISNSYLDSVAFEKDAELWKRQWADVLRHADLQLVCVVAMITGGWDLARQLSGPMLEQYYLNHKERYGVPE